MEKVKMLKQLILILGVCTIAHGLQTKVLLKVRLRRETANENETYSHTHSHVHDNETDVARDESAHYVSALFEIYNGSSHLSLDGFARLLCKLRLIPELADIKSGADDTLHAGEGDRHTPLDCGRITFDQVPATFKNSHDDDDHSAHEHGHEGHDHSDEHGDHDHQPYRSGRSGKTDSGLSSASSNHNSEADHHDHADHDHDHDHQDHDHHHGDESSQTNEDAVTASSANSASDEAVKSSVAEKTSDSGDQGPAKPSRSKRRALPVSDSSSSQSDAQGDGSKAHHDHSAHLEKCSSPKELLEFFHIPEKDLDVQQFTLLCPALLYNLDAGNCRQHDHDHDDGGEGVEPSTSSAIPPKVWGYSTAAVVVISLAGLLGVAAIPIMQKVFYNHLLQFLVAIAVGALSGDALLHLLPHAIAKNQMHQHNAHHSHDALAEEASHEAEHLESVWKGMVALICIFFFFLVERILTIVTEKKRRKKTMSRQEKKRCERLCDAEKGSRVGAKLSARDAADHGDCEQMVMVVHPNRALKGYADATHDVVMHHCDHSLMATPEPFDHDDDDNHPDHNPETSDHHHNNSTTSSHAPTLGHAHAHGHTHAHGHAHGHLGSVPGSVAAVAWMVIFGDGIHNFSDGLAIGAAFASSVTGGISTSIAVFCHELPHEIGDFAVLLRAGMSVKQAVVYNCVSSVLCFIGMLVGVAIGNVSNASLWIFAGVGGMFIYISMVDMLPEMTAVDTKKGENQFLHLLLQVGGMLIGSGIMLLIAVFEHDLQRLLDG